MNFLLHFLLLVSLWAKDWTPKSQRSQTTCLPCSLGFRSRRGKHPEECLAHRGLCTQKWIFTELLLSGTLCVSWGKSSDSEAHGLWFCSSLLFSENTDVTKEGFIQRDSY